MNEGIWTIFCVVFGWGLSELKQHLHNDDRL